MTSISFAVIGERRDDPMVLLMRGDDGQHYAYDLTTDHVAPVAPEAEEQFDLLTPPDNSLGWEPLADPLFP